MNRELEEEWWYHQNAKWDYNEELKKEHHDPESFRDYDAVSYTHLTLPTILRV